MSGFDAASSHRIRPPEGHYEGGLASPTAACQHPPRCVALLSLSLLFCCFVAVLLLACCFSVFVLFLPLKHCQYVLVKVLKCCMLKF